MNFRNKDMEYFGLTPQEQFLKDRITWERLITILSDIEQKELKKFLMLDCQEVFNFQIVDENDIIGEKQLEENYWFKFIYLVQSCGYTGDDYSGIIWIPLKDGNFFRFSYVC